MITEERQTQSDTSPTGCPPLWKERIRTTSEKLPLFSQAAFEAYQMAASPDSSTSVLAGAIQWDPYLAAKILGLANSALYAPAKPIERLEDAILLIGFQELKGIILAAATAGFVNRLTFAQERQRNMLCHHACLTAIYSRQMASHLRLSLRGAEFCAGLLHDIGRLLFAAWEPEKLATCGPGDFPASGEELDLLRREIECFGVDHCELGRTFCEANRIPKSLGDCVAHHHRPQELVGDSSLVSLVAAADRMANHQQITSAEQPYLPEQDAELQALLSSASHGQTPGKPDWLTLVAAQGLRQASTMTLLFTSSSP